MSNTKYLFKCNDCPAQEYTDDGYKECPYCDSPNCDNVLLKEANLEELDLELRAEAAAQESYDSAFGNEDEL